MKDHRFRHILKHHSQDIIIVTDKNEKIIWVNDWFTTLTEYEFEEVKGKKPGAFLKGKETDKVTIKTMRSAIARGEKFNVNVVNYTKSGKKYWLNISCSPVFDEHNEIEYFIAIERDITTEYELNQIKLNRLIEEQQQLCAEKSKLIEHMCILAHDLKAPLTNIQSLLNISPTADKSADLLLKKEVKRSQNLIHKILSNAVNESGKTDLVLTHFMPTKVLSHLTQANKIGLTAKKLTTSLHCSDELRLYSDEILFTQTLENLFVNAIKYACYASQIKFKIWQEGEEIKLIISNKTEHLQGWQLENLFKPFQNFQVQNSQNSNGMGTYIVQKHLALIGGEISASIMDKILRFELTIPNFKGDIKTSDPTHSDSLPFNSI